MTGAGLGSSNHLRKSGLHRFFSSSVNSKVGAIWTSVVKRLSVVW